MNFFGLSISKSIDNTLGRSLRYELLENRHLLTAVVLSTSPLADSASVPVDASIEAMFDATISPASVTDQTFVVHRQQSGQLLSALGDITSLASVGNQVTLDPADNFYPGELIQVTATAGLLDSSSTAAAPYVWEFRAATAGGDGAFSDSGQSLGNAAGWHVALGDIDSDGDLDAVVSNLQISGLPEQVSRLWLNQGGLQGGVTGQFVDSGQSLDDTRPHDLALGDLDLDGDLDIFFGNSTGRPDTIWVNQGGLQGGTEGVFADSGQLLGNSSTRGVSLGDLDGDGDLDAFASNRSNQANLVWINQGGAQGGIAGQFADSGQLLGSSASFDAVLGDLDGDGDLDAFVVNGSPLGTTTGQANLIWINDGTGTFTDSGQALGSFRDNAVSLGDLDGDLDLDAFVASRFGNRIWLNQGGAQNGIAGQFVDSGQALGGNINSLDVSLGDLDGDGDLDAFIVNADSNSMNTVWINQGGIQGGVASTFSSNGQSLGSSKSRGVSLGDLDNDGDLDAFVVNRGVGQPDLIWLNQGPSADFDSDGDVDGADFLAWQQGFGVANGAMLGDGDANGNGVVDQADLVVWERQLGTTSILPLTTSCENPADQPPGTLVVAESIAPAPQQADVQFANVWLVFPNYQLRAAIQNDLHRAATMGTEPLSNQHADHAFEEMALDVERLEFRQAVLRFSAKDLETLAASRLAVDFTEEGMDPALAGLFKNVALRSKLPI